ncbi:transposase [Gracilimonas sp.]|uniref:transposase n=1 Tax=Gracilimonas sp. TaxID=1974203 RepID=UPI00287103B5|nr:transposase [Gracilimonas sp.]
MYLDIINGVEDHVHCLIRLKTTQCVADVIGVLKGETSFWLNRNVILDEHFDWQDGYGVISVSPREVNGIRKYIYNQEAHHGDMSLNEEFKKLNFTKEINKPRPSGLS